MSDTSILGGILGLGSPSYDPVEAKGYLSDLKGQQTKTEAEYQDAISKRRERLKQMEDVVSNATNALVEARTGRTNLPMMAAAAGLMAPTQTGGLGASISQALGAAGPALEKQRAGETAHITQMANLKSVPITMGEGVDKDVAAQLATRANTLQTQSSAVQRGMMTAQTQGMKGLASELEKMRKQAATEAKNQMASALHQGATYEGDDAEVHRQLTETIYNNLFYQRWGQWPGQLHGKEMTAEDIAASTKQPRLIPKESDDERKFYTQQSTAGVAADQQLSALEFSEQRNPVPGMLSGPAQWASRVAEVFNIGGDWGKMIADAGNDIGKQKAVLGNFVLEMQKQQKGVQTDADARRMAATIANTDNTVELNKMMYSWMKSQAVGAKWQAEQLDRYVTGNKGRASGINAFANKQKLDLVRSAGDAKITLWDYVEAYRRQNPDMPKEEATNKAISMWQSLN